MCLSSFRRQTFSREVSEAVHISMILFLFQNLTKHSHSSVLVIPADDLRLAEEVATYGTAKQRKEAGRDECESIASIEQHEGLEPPDDFQYNHVGLSSDRAALLLKEYGLNELPEYVEPKWIVFLKLLFCAPMPIMIWIAIIIEAGIMNWLDMGILLLIQFTNASISFYETNKAGNAVAALKSSLRPSATAKRDGEWQVIDATLLVPGDLGKDTVLYRTFCLRLRQTITLISFDVWISSSSWQRFCSTCRLPCQRLRD